MRRRNRLAAALRISGPTLVYAVERIADATAAIEAITGERVEAIDAASLPATIDERRGSGRPIVLILDERIPARAREVLSDLGEEIRVVALCSARTPSDEMAALFPLRLAAVRAFEEVQ